MLDFAAAGLRSEADAMATRSADLLARGELRHTSVAVAAFLAEASTTFSNPGWVAQSQAEFVPHKHNMITDAFGWRVLPAGLHLGQAALTSASTTRPSG